MAKRHWAATAIVFVLLTSLTQLGGIAWLISVRCQRKLFVFVCSYSLVCVLAFSTAPLFGRVALPCFGDTLRMHSVAYCVLLRNFVTPDLADVVLDAANDVATQFPGTVTLVLDGNFPFLNGMPLLPHLSHDDGQKLDLAFYYARDGKYLAGETRSPVGYWAFESSPDKTCPPSWLTMRWDLTALQSLWTSLEVDVERTRTMLNLLLLDPRVAKVFVEPSLAKTWDIGNAKLRFQGCRAARHDDHIHLQL